MKFNHHANNNMLKHALKYLSLGWAVIPVKLSHDYTQNRKVVKRPLVRWKQYQDSLPTKKDIVKWWTVFPDAQIGVVTGKISRLVVIDIDVGFKQHDVDILELPPTAIAQTPSGGYHYYFTYPHKCHFIASRASIMHADSHIDIRADGGYAVIPPSKCLDGRAYIWSVSPEMVTLPDIPAKLLKLITQRAHAAVSSPTNLFYGVSQGKRNDTAARVVGKILHGTKPELWETTAWPALKAWNEKNSPPLPEQELRTVFTSITKRELQKNSHKFSSSKRPKYKTKELMELIDNSNVEFFHDQFGEPFLRINIANHWEIWPADSKKIKRWIAGMYWDRNHDFLSQQLTKNIVNILEHKACNKSKRHTLHNRIAYYDNAIWYDLADERWRAVRIDRHGWKIIDKPPILFRRHSHQISQVEPGGNGNVSLLLDFLDNRSHYAPDDNNDNNDNDDKADVESQILLIVFIISCFIPDIAHPVINIYGQQGSAKTTRSKIIKQLIDPSILDILSFPKNTDELIQQLSHHWFAFYDNVENLSNATSNILCRAVTGEGVSKRSLYTNDEDFMYSFKRCIGLNGINCSSSRPDLLDRSLLFTFNRIPNTSRKLESDIWAEFNQIKPRILGAIFNILTQTLRIYPSIKLSCLPRMADFAKWGCAIAEAMGLKQEVFLDAYQENIKLQNEEILQEDTLAHAIKAFVTNYHQWSGTASELFTVLEERAEELKINIKAKDWPKSTQQLGRRLNELEHTLCMENIHIEKQRTQSNRCIIFKKIKSANSIVSNVMPTPKVDH